MTQPVKLIIPSDSKFLGLARKALEYLMSCYEVPDETTRKLMLCVDEACSNIIKYSYGGETNHTIEISYLLEDETFTVNIRDYGRQCDTKTFKPRCLDELKPGGLGTYFINQIMDKVTYCTKRDTGTLLTMTKNLKTELSKRSD